MQRTSRKMERRTANLVGGRCQPGSGNTRHAKGDVRSSSLLIERKDTAASSYTVRVADLRRILAQAALDGRDPVFVVGFNSVGEEYAIVPLADYLHLRGKL